MIHRPLKAKHVSRYAMGLIFLFCGLLLLAANIAAASAFLILSAFILFFAPRWNLSIELTPNSIRFSENVVETTPVVLDFADLLEIRRVKEKENRKGFFTPYPEYYALIEFVTHAGKIYRMNDIFSEVFDDALARQGEALGVNVKGFDPLLKSDPESPLSPEKEPNPKSEA